MSEEDAADQPTYFMPNVKVILDRVKWALLDPDQTVTITITKRVDRQQDGE